MSVFRPRKPTDSRWTAPRPQVERKATETSPPYWGAGPMHDQVLSLEAEEYRLGCSQSHTVQATRVAFRKVAYAT